jgi:hypothetical protein
MSKKYLNERTCIREIGNQALRRSFIHLMTREYIISPSKNRKNMQTTPRNSYQRHANASPFIRKPPERKPEY